MKYFYFFLLLIVAATKTKCSLELPQGSYQNSCHCSVDDRVLSCECLSRSLKKVVSTEIDPRVCAGREIVNNDGMLECESQLWSELLPGFLVGIATSGIVWFTCFLICCNALSQIISERNGHPVDRANLNRAEEEASRLALIGMAVQQNYYR